MPRGWETVPDEGTAKSNGGGCCDECMETVRKAACDLCHDCFYCFLVLVCVVFIGGAVALALYFHYK